ncbi:protein CEBPZOS [Centruroides vittatus]|uniref:protein CEBPZOS n=1 Tax=Centruroides vittatus TaxID=120091 RepID=UPI00350F66D6
MLQKFIKRNSYIGTLFKGLVAIEVGFFAVSFYYYHKMNTSSEFRRKMYDQNYTILDGFYKLGEFFGDTKTRELDLQMWGIEDKKTSSN